MNATVRINRRKDGFKLSEQDEQTIYDMMMSANAANAIEAAPAILAQYTGIIFEDVDTSNAKLSVADALRAEFAYSGRWSGAGDVICNAAWRVYASMGRH